MAMDSPAIDIVPSEIIRIVSSEIIRIVSSEIIRIDLAFIEEEYRVVYSQALSFSPGAACAAGGVCGCAKTATWHLRLLAPPEDECSCIRPGRSSPLDHPFLRVSESFGGSHGSIPPEIFSLLVQNP